MLSQLLTLLILLFVSQGSCFLVPENSLISKQPKASRRSFEERVLEVCLKSCLVRKSERAKKELTVFAVKPEDSNLFCNECTEIDWEFSSNKSVNVYDERILNFQKLEDDHCEEKFNISYLFPGKEILRVFCPLIWENSIICDLLFSIPPASHLLPIIPESKIKIVSSCSFLQETFPPKDKFSSIYLKHKSPLNCMRNCLYASHVFNTIIPRDQIYGVVSNSPTGLNYEFNFPYTSLYEWKGLTSVFADLEILPKTVNEYGNCHCFWWKVAPIPKHDVISETFCRTCSENEAYFCGGDNPNSNWVNLLLDYVSIYKIEENNLSVISWIDALETKIEENNSSSISWTEALETKIEVNNSSSNSWVEALETKIEENNSSSVSWIEALETKIEENNSSSISWTEALETKIEENNSSSISWTEALETKIEENNSSSISWTEALETKIEENNSSSISWTEALETKIEENNSSSISWIEALETKIENVTVLNFELANSILYDMEDNIENDRFRGTEINNIIRLGGNVVEKLDKLADFKTLENITEQTIINFDKILQNEVAWSQISMIEKMATGTLFLEELNQIAFKFTPRLEEKLSGDNQSLSKTFQVTEFVLYTGAAVNLSSTYPTNTDNEASFIELPKTLTENEESVAESKQFFSMELGNSKANEIFTTSGPQENLEENITEKVFVLNGPMLTMNITTNNSSDDQQELEIMLNQTGLKISFKHSIPTSGDDVKDLRRKLHDGEKPNGASNTLKCVYWNKRKSVWSSNGCHLISTEISRSVCECKHFGSFGLLVSFHRYMGKGVILEFLSQILCILSSVSLLICIIVYSLKKVKSPERGGVRRRDKCARTTRILCSYLLLGNVMYIFSIDRNLLNLNENFCTLFGGLSHFIYLLAFVWMGVDGWQQCLSVCSVMKDQMSSVQKTIFGFMEAVDSILRKRKVMQYILPNLIPAIVVGGTTIGSLIQGRLAYGGDAYCWIDENYMWTFMAPIGVVIVMNTVFMMHILWVTHFYFHKSQFSNTRKNKSFFYWAEKSYALSVLLGITWVAGYFMIVEYNSVGLVAEYVFVILNACQGLFILVFRVLRNKKIRDAIKESLGIKKEVRFCQVFGRRRRYEVTRNEPSSERLDQSWMWLTASTVPSKT